MSIHRRRFLHAGAWMASAFALGACASAPAASGAGAATPPAPGPSPEAKPPAAAEKSGKKKILILGGTAFLGPQLVEAARARGHTLTLFNRGKTNAELFPDIEKLKGDRDGDLKALEGRSWDAVIDTSGYVPRIVKASAKLLAPSVKQYIFISSISVYADTSKEGMDETGRLETVPDPASEEVRKYYGGLKALCEQAAEAEMPGRVANVRPGLIVGPGDSSDRFTYWPVRIEKGGEVLAPGGGGDPVQIIDVRDLAEWIILLVEQGDVGVYNALGPEGRLTMAELLGACKTVTGSDAKLTWVDAKFLEAQKVAPWSDMPVWAPPEPDNAGFGTMSRERAIKRGLRFRPVDATVRDTLAWWKTLPEERRSKLRAGISAEREAEVLAAWRASQEPEKSKGKDKPRPKEKGKDDKKKTGRLERPFMNLRHLAPRHASAMAPVEPVPWMSLLGAPSTA